MGKDRFTNLCDLGKAKILNKYYFASALTQDPGSALPNLSPSSYHPKLPSFEASSSERPSC